MEIRELLTTQRLTESYGEATMARAHDCIERVLEVQITRQTPTSVTATAFALGTSPTAYSVQFHAECHDVGDWIFNACTCPVGRMCKHGAAVGLLLHMAPTTPGPGRWRNQLEELTRQLTSRASATLAGMPLALQVSVEQHGWYDRGKTSLTLRPLRPAARGGWVKSGAEWHDISGPVSRSRFVPAHADAVLQILHDLNREYGVVGPGRVPRLQSFGSRLVPNLRTAVEAGVTLMAGEGLTDVALSATPLELILDVTRQENRSVLEVAVDHEGRRWRGEQVLPIGQPATALALLDDGHAVLADLVEPIQPAMASLLTAADPVVAEDHDSADFFQALVPLAAHLRLSSSDGSYDLPTRPKPTLRVLVTWRSSTSAELRWTWSYGQASCEIGARDPLGGVRDLDAEARIRATVPEGLLGRPLAMDGDALALALHDLPHLRTLPDIEVDEVERPEFREAADGPQIEFLLAPEQPDHTDWLDLEVHISVEGESVPLPDVLAAITRADEFLTLPSGLYVSLDRPEFTKLHEAVAAAAQLRESTGDRVSVGRNDLGVWAELAELGVVDEQVATWVARAAALRDLQEIPHPDPVGLSTTLRPYQLEGFWWLAFLHEHGLGGILADDMGLGKTLQVLALFQHAISKGEDRAFLVVAPTSVVTAWQAQARTHAPALRVGCVLKRTDDVAQIAADSDVVLTTYTLLRLGQDRFAEVPFAGVILDEAQQVKNHQSKAYAAVRTLSADFRLAVTGTPFENRLMELWALLSITCPGLYPSPKRFRDMVVKPVEKDGDQASLQRFRTRIRPFLLRRTKELVAADLPPKQEQVLEVELTPRHRKVYDTHLARERQKILGLVEDFDRNRVAIFSALTKLRQLALDPALIDPAHEQIGSAKLDLLAEQLGEITAEGHRALVFSQFTSYLTRVRERLTAEGIDTVYLDGATRDRATVIERFRQGDAPVFLISLKAGGVGLTLTEADYVYVLDPWWNPAAESQAVDRAHRIGQDKHVHVYRLVAADTIEEKVMELKARKAALFAQVIDAGVTKTRGITAKDIRGLFD